MEYVLLFSRNKGIKHQNDRIRQKQAFQQQYTINTY